MKTGVTLFLTGAVLLCWSAACYAAEYVSREEFAALQREIIELRGLVQELKTVIKQQQETIQALEAEPHAEERTTASVDKEDSHKVAAREKDHNIEELLGNIKPRISATGDFVANLSDDRHMRTEDDRFDLRGVDIDFIGEIDEVARAYFNISYHDDDLSLEEGYLDAWDVLPFKTDVRLGRFRVNFGLLNTIHPHALTQVDYPAIYRVFLGHEGYIDEGVGIAGEFPSLWKSPFSYTVQVVNGKRHEHEDEDEHEEEVRPYKRLKDFDDTVYIGRLKNRIALRDNLSLDWGLSGLTGRFEETGDAPRYYLEGADLTLTWHPFQETYKRLQWQTESFLSQVEGTRRETSHGLYSFIDYRFAPKWSGGVRYDYTQLPLNSRDHLREYSLYLTHQYSPNNRLRVQVKNAQRNFAKDTTELFLQWTFTLGRHEHLEGAEH
ncbi:MAG: hypothetical protein N3B18_11850 [Desulfobacterota bacterium]|nr:hypothetical protein [Thermodesulfobacteriota bacterium]